MRKLFSCLPFCFLFFIFLYKPSVVVAGAANGLLLWFNTVLPTLFPFFVITSLMTASNAFQFISTVFAPVFSRLFGISSSSIIAVIGGFFCGYPMGAKIVSDLWKTNQISTSEGLYLLSFCNNASPMFIISFFLIQKLERPDLVIPSVFILFSSPIICSFFFRKYYDSSYVGSNSERCYLKPVNYLELFDDAISNGMETILKIGGYIMFFSILISLLYQLPLKNTILTLFIIPSLEITNGVNILAAAQLPFMLKYMLMMGHVSFGGICAIFQTRCVLKDGQFNIKIYTIEKLITAMVTSLIAFLYLVLSKFSF